MKPAELFAKNVKKRMAELDLTHLQLAEQLGVKRSMVTNYLRGKTAPGAGLMQAWAKALGCTVSDLLDGSEAPPVLTREPSAMEVLAAVVERWELHPKRKDLILSLLKGHLEDDQVEALELVLAADRKVLGNTLRVLRRPLPSTGENNESSSG